MYAGRISARRSRYLLLAEGLAVGALVHGRGSLMGAYQNPVQRTVVFTLAVICTFLYGALNALVCMTVHILSDLSAFAFAMRS